MQEKLPFGARITELRSTVRLARPDGNDIYL